MKLLNVQKTHIPKRQTVVSIRMLCCINVHERNLTNIILCNLIYIPVFQNSQNYQFLRGTSSPVMYKGSRTAQLPCIVFLGRICVPFSVGQCPATPCFGWFVVKYILVEGEAIKGFKIKLVLGPSEG